EDIKVRRNTIADSYNLTSHSQGLYASGATRLLIEENVFDHNGWHASVPGAEPTMFNHNCYLNAGDGMIDLHVRGNIFANASSFGLTASSNIAYGQIRPLIEENLFLRNGNSFTHGSKEDFGIKDTTIRNNVFLDIGRTIGGVSQSYGVDLKSTDGAMITGN